MRPHHSNLDHFKADWRFSLLVIMGLIKRELKRQFRFNFDLMLGAPLTTFLYLTVFRLAANDPSSAVAEAQSMAIAGFVGLGMIGITSFMAAYHATSFSLLFDRMEHIVDDLLMAPVTGWEIALGYGLSATVVAFVQASLVGIVVVLMQHSLHPHFAIVLFFLLIGSVSQACLGLLAAIFSIKWDGLSAKETFFTLPLIQLSGAFFPLEAVTSPFWRLIMQLNPYYYLMDGLRQGLGGEAHNSLAFTALISLGWMMALLGTTHYIFRHGIRLKS